MIHQVGSHGDKLAGHLQIHLLALFQIILVLVQYQRNGDILYFYFIFTQQEQDQIQRPLKSSSGSPPLLCTTFSSLKIGLSKLTPQKPTMHGRIDTQRMAVFSALLRTE